MLLSMRVHISTRLHKTYYRTTHPHGLVHLRIAVSRAQRRQAPLRQLDRFGLVGGTLQAGEGFEGVVGFEQQTCYWHGIAWHGMVWHGMGWHVGWCSTCRWHGMMG